MTERLELKAIVADPGQPEWIIAPRGRDAWALQELVKAGRHARYVLWSVVRIAA
jgi:hypothetical protein